MKKKRSLFLFCLTVFGFSFLYLPIISLIIYSFNKSKLVTVWGGFSFKWYAQLFQDTQIIEAAWISFKIASISATIAVVLGTMAALVLTRIKRFPFKGFFNSMIIGPLVMPEVITGLSLLLLFIVMESLFGWPSGRGVVTIIIAHSTFCMAYVTIIIQARLVQFDRSIEEAATDLGATQLSVFFTITLPIIFPAILSGWLLAFTLSLDDIVIASFVSGPASSTLPIVVFSKIRLGVSPDINALATLFILFILISIIALYFLQIRKQKSLL